MGEEQHEDFGVAYSQSSDLNPVKMLWFDIKKSGHVQKPSNEAD